MTRKNKINEAIGNVGAFCFGAGVLALGFQVVSFLKTAHWVPMPASELLDEFGLIKVLSSWVGLQLLVCKVFNFVSIPVVVFCVAFGLMYLSDSDCFGEKWVIDNTIETKEVKKEESNKWNDDDVNTFLGFAFVTVVLIIIFTLKQLLK